MFPLIKLPLVMCCFPVHFFKNLFIVTANLPNLINFNLGTKLALVPFDNTCNEVCK